MKARNRLRFFVGRFMISPTFFCTNVLLRFPNFVLKCCATYAAPPPLLPLCSIVFVDG
jgi:hypothetical protein